jgi:uncharacterized protein YdaU (DUF1376 family)
MALRDQPYLPLYVQDYLTDEKLNNCSPASQGIYIKIMCLFHKCDPYGGILLKQSDKQKENICLNFACKLAKQLPFDTQSIIDALEELLDEKALTIDGDFLYQKRMVKDNEISNLRSEIGKKGGKKTQNNNKKFAKAKVKANYEYEYEDEIDNNIDYFIVFDNFRKLYPGTKRGNETELENLKRKHKDWKKIIPILLGSLEYQINKKEDKILKGEFVPEWKNLQTWINQRCWEEEIKFNENGNQRKKGTTGATDFEVAAIVANTFAGTE